MVVGKQELNDWFERVSDQKFHCTTPENVDLKSVNSLPLLEVVDCGDPSAIYRYDIKVLGQRQL